MRLLVMYVNYLENYFIVLFVYLFIYFKFSFSFLRTWAFMHNHIYYEFAVSQPAPYKSAERKYHVNLHGNRMATGFSKYTNSRWKASRANFIACWCHIYVCLVFYDSHLRSGRWVTVGKMRIGIVNEANGDWSASWNGQIINTIN